MERKCKTCKFAEKLPPDPREIGKVDYMCREGPPQVVALVTATGVQIQSMQPPVPPEHWCYKYEPKIELNN